MTLGLTSLDALLAHPVVGSSWEGFVIETLLNVAPREAPCGFYRSSNGRRSGFAAGGSRLWLNRH